MTALPPEELLIHTLELLEYRLQRLEYLFNGGDTPTDAAQKLPKGTTAVQRLHKLQNVLGQLAARSRAVEQLLRLQAAHPDLFTPSAAETNTNTKEPPDHATKLTLVLASTPTLLTLSSQLRSLVDVPLPPTSSFTHLLAQTPRFAAIQARQEEQGRQIAELRRRSAVVVGRWYEGGVVGVGRCWADWEGRVRGVERGVGRGERAREGD